jgi:hypothetical protein
VVTNKASAAATDDATTATASIILFTKLETLFFEACPFVALLES